MGIKHVFMNHGAWPHSPNNLGRMTDPYWHSFDLLCGMTNKFDELFKKHSTVKTPISIGTCGQVDTLYEQNLIKDQTRNKIIGSGEYEKVITIFANRCKNRISMNPFNEGYFRTAIEMGRLAKKHNWLVLIKTKRDPMEYLKSCKTSWRKDVHEPYKALKNNSHVRFINHNQVPYGYLCASDAVIVCARSTVEMEAAMINKPLIKLWIPEEEVTENIMSYECGAMEIGAAYVVERGDDLEAPIMHALSHPLELKPAQDQFLKELGVVFDGKANERFLQEIRRIV